MPRRSEILGLPPMLDLTLSRLRDAPDEHHHEHFFPSSCVPFRRAPSLSVALRPRPAERGEARKSHASPRLTRRNPLLRERIGIEPTYPLVEGTPDLKSACSGLPFESCCFLHEKTLPDRRHHAGRHFPGAGGGRSGR